MSDPLRVCERFYSLQGESTRAGLPCCFIRLAGCNLRCTYCDSPYAWDETLPMVESEEIVAWCATYPALLCEITGGEPLLQDNVYPLCQRLLDRGHPVMIETNGSISLRHLPVAVTAIVDIKCPGSAMHGRFHWPNLDWLARRRENGGRDEIKFVISCEEDFHWARGLMRQYRLERLAPVLFSPVRDRIEPARLAELLLAHRLEARLQLQLHTLLWPDRDRGV